MLRRNFLAYLGTLPVISDWKEALGYTRPKRLVRDQKWKDMFFAVEILRLINTTEKWNFQATGGHVAAEHLHECIGYKKLTEKIPQRFRGVSGKFPSDGSFQLNGYDIFVAPNADLSRYVAAVSMKGPEYNFTFVSDELGMIYEGPLGTETGYADISKSLVEARAKGSDTPAPNVEAGWWPSRLLATIMFSRFLGFATPPQQNFGCVCCNAPFHCPSQRDCTCHNDCPTNCQSGYSYCCVNCGTCSNCAWVRDSVCTIICDCYTVTCDVQECCFSAGADCICQCG